MILKHFSRNRYGRDFVTGDIHGCYDELMESLQKIDFNFETDRLFAVGDLIDRGAKSYECFNLIFEPWFFSVRGNHEEMMIDAILYDCPIGYRTWMMNGGTWGLTVIDDPEFRMVLEDCSQNFFPLAIEVETDNGLVGIVHGKPPALWSQDIIRDTRMSILWSSKSGSSFTCSGINKVFVGHIVQDQPVPYTYGGNIYYLDNGKVFYQNRDIVITEL